MAAVAEFALADERAAHTRPLSFAVVSGANAASMAAEWGDLASRSADDNIFFDPDFVIPALNALPGGVSVAAATDIGGRLAAAAPFTRTRLGRVAPAVRLWGHKYAPLGVPLVAGARLDANLATLVDGLAPPRSGLCVIAPDVPADGPIATALRRLALAQGRPLDLLGAHRRAMLDRAAAANLRTALPASRRKELGRQMRRLADGGPVTVDAATEPRDVRAAFEAFLALERSGWKGRAGTALASSAETAAFAREVVARLCRSGGARVDSICVGGRPVAMVVTLLAGTTAWTWKIAYDETFARFSPGAQLMLEAPARILADRRIARIDSCAVADHPMIDRLWPGRLAVATFVLGPRGGGLLHRAGLAVAKAEVAARVRLRQLRG